MIDVVLFCFVCRICRILFTSVMQLLHGLPQVLT